MANNFLKYSALTYDEILTQIQNKLNADSRFENFRESAISQTLVEVFAAVADLCNYYVERRAEECYFDTAKLKSSVILLARSLGYDVVRPIPASGKIKIRLSGNFKTDGGNPIFSVNEKLQIPYQSVFTYEGQKYVLKKTFTMQITQTMLTDMIRLGSSYESDYITVDLFGDDINIVQGEIKEKVIHGENNQLIGSKFQLYEINDTEFSNIYGSDDYDTPVTKVWVGNTKSSSTQFDIDRRSLINWESLESLQEGQTRDVCVIRTSKNEGIELIFGDSRYATMGADYNVGATTTFDNVYIQYLATKGSAGNKSGLSNKKINYSGKVYTSQKGIDITNKVNFYFNGNMTGGANLESIDDIRINAPNIYYTLDRLVTSRDYVTYLKSLTSPINIKNAIAWGEQEEIEKREVDAISKMFNIVLFSCVGSLYQTDSSPYNVKTKDDGLNTAVLDYDFDENSISKRNYFNVYSKQESISQLKEYETSANHWEMLGNGSSTETTQVYYYNTFEDSMTLNYKYTSINSDNAPTLSADASISVDISDFDGTVYTSDVSAMNILATRITSGLVAKNDLRGDHISNANYGNPSFGNVACQYDSDNSRFKIVHNADDECYIYYLSGTASDALGLTDQPPDRVFSTTTGLLDYDIVSVIDKLDTRSQVTIRNIYISPIIQNFDLNGTVYVNNLYDLQDTRVDVEDAIYNWLDVNADFNEEIFLSNIVEVIEQFPNVRYANVNLLPETLNGGPFYVSGSNAVINTYDTSATIYDEINTALISYLGEADDTDVSGSSDRLITYCGTTLQSYSYSWNVDINERTFFDTFVKTVFDSLKTVSYSFVYSQDFNKVMSDIHKDLLPIIRYNMLDTQGNIHKEYSGTSWLKGGYSLGNEVVKINCDLTFQYVS